MEKLVPIRYGAGFTDSQLVDRLVVKLWMVRIVSNLSSSGLDSLIQYRRSTDFDVFVRGLKDLVTSLSPVEGYAYNFSTFMQTHKVRVKYHGSPDPLQGFMTSYM